MTTTGNAPVRHNNYPLSSQVAIEALGSFVIVFAAIATASFISSAPTVAMASGLSLLVVIIAFGNVTKGYFNPAFSLALAVGGRIKWASAILFVVAQVIGAFAAAFVLYAVIKSFPTDAGITVSKAFTNLANGYDSHSPVAIPLAGVLVIEIVLSAVLAAVLLSSTSSANKSPLAPMAIGIAMVVAMFISIPVSNGSLNPARAFSVVFLSESWALGQVWLFVVAPLFGAALAGALYRTFKPAEVVVIENDADAVVIADLASADAPDTQADADSPVAVPVSAVVVEDVVVEEVVVEAPHSTDAQDFFDKPTK